MDLEPEVVKILEALHHRERRSEESRTEVPLQRSPYYQVQQHQYLGLLDEIRALRAQWKCVDTVSEAKKIIQSSEKLGKGIDTFSRFYLLSRPERVQSLIADFHELHKDIRGSGTCGTPRLIPAGFHN